MKRILIYILFLSVVSAITLYFLSTFSGGIEWAKVFNFFFVNVWGWIGIASLMISWLMDTLITYIMILKITNVKFSFLKSFNMSVIGIFFNKLSPASTGGSVFQIAYLRNNGLNLGTSISVTELRYIIKQSAMVFLAAFGFIDAIPIISRNEIVFILSLTGFVISVGGILILVLANMSAKSRNYMIKTIKWFINLLRFSKRLSPKIPDLNLKVEMEFRNYTESLRLISKNWKVVTVIFILALISAIAHLFLAFAAVQSFGIFENIPRGIVDVLSLQAIATMVIFFSPTPGSSGLAESGFFLFFSTLIPPKFLGTVTLEWRILSYFLPLLISGIIFLFISLSRMVKR
ncbi:MAG: lysylphosphatidylglycerol synthase transmembrane domain-containing protein [Athalassotoga sp.]|uniref:lysylphosphatidylglycerol synthase transmembrane domain-containing protein n=1 Tax=Athalassotoga sp. TaxID=2022597 RepID=UPI003D06A37F